MRPVNYIPENSRLIFVKDLGTRFYSGKKSRFALYKCSCGNVREFLVQSVKSGESKSCGCIVFKHGYYNYPLYRIWQDMRQRCHNKNNKRYDDYGGRGITVCDEWMNPKIFIEWALPLWKEELQIDRRDNGGDYCPENCRFVTQKENLLNKRLLRKDNTSGYCGVIYDRGKWESRIWINGRIFHLGRFDSKKLAAIRYDVEAYLTDNRPRNLIG